MSIWLSIHLWRGIGISGGLFPELRLGIVSVGCCRGAIAEHIRKARHRAECVLSALVLGAKK